VTVLRRMCDLTVNANYRLKRLADALNAEGFRTRKGHLWSNVTVLQTLYNPSSAGTLVYGRRRKANNADRGIVETKGVFPAVFSEEEWATLMGRRRIHQELSKGRARSSSYLLSGILRCGLWESAMSGKVSKNGGNTYRQYVCIARHSAKEACEHGRYYSTVGLERAILDFLGQYSDESKVRALLAASEDTAIQRSQAELEAVQKRLKELDSMVMIDLDRLDRGILSEMAYKRQAEKREAGMARLREREAIIKPLVETEKANSAKAAKVAVRVRSFFEDFSQIQDVKRHKALLQGLIKTAHVCPDGRIEIEFR
jgi:site-specific DNA recombinase